MAALDPAVAAIRTAVRHCLRPLPTTQPVLVACSGGADSLALAAAAGFVGPRLGLRVGLVTVDHGLQPGSTEQAEKVAIWARGQGFEPVVATAAVVAGRPGGPEAAARQARYDALVRSARAHSAQAILLGHTREDQAETVLLALLRGAGSRGLAGMPPRRDVDGVALLRPLLGVERAATVAACRVQGLPVWTDPHNSDPAYARVRARALLKSLVDSLGPGVVGNLARSAELAAADTAALDAMAAAVPVDVAGLPVATLTGLPTAIRTRVLHSWAKALGAPGEALGYRHIRALDALVTDWHGQGPVYLPGGIEINRRDGLLEPREP